MQIADRHPATRHLMRYFAAGHLPPDLREVSEQIGTVATAMVECLPDGPELTVGLRKLVEAKDCLVRAALDAREAP